MTTCYRCGRPVTPPAAHPRRRICRDCLSARQGKPTPRPKAKAKPTPKAKAKPKRPTYHLAEATQAAIAELREIRKMFMAENHALAARPWTIAVAEAQDRLEIDYRQARFDAVAHLPPRQRRAAFDRFRQPDDAAPAPRPRLAPPAPPRPLARIIPFPVRRPHPPGPRPAA